MDWWDELRYEGFSEVDCGKRRSFALTFVCQWRISGADARAAGLLAFIFVALLLSSGSSAMQGSGLFWRCGFIWAAALYTCVRQNAAAAAALIVARNDFGFRGLLNVSSCFILIGFDLKLLYCCEKGQRKACFRFLLLYLSACTAGSSCWWLRDSALITTCWRHVGASGSSFCHQIKSN